MKDDEASEACGCKDEDDDGYSICDGDCDDSNTDDGFNTNPGAEERCDNLRDDNCNGRTDEQPCCDARDRDGDGVINSGRELFGNFTPQPDPPPGESRNGFLALAEFDRAERGGHSDGRIDARDAVFTALRLWRDSNHDGVSEPRELHTLPSGGVSSLEVDYRESRRRDRHGNLFRYRAKVYGVVVARPGRWAWDVFLVNGQ